MGASLSEVGLIASIPGVATVALAAPLGLLSDRKGRAAILFVGAIGIGAGILMVGFSTTTLHVLFAAGLVGVATAMFDPIVAAAVGDVSKIENMGKAFGVLTAGILIGLAGGPAVGGLLVESFGFRVAFVASGVLGLLAGLFVLPFLFGKNKLEMKYSLSGRRKMTRAVWIGWLSTFFIFFATGGAQVFAPIYARTIGFSESFSVLLVAMLFIVSAASRIPSGAILDKSGKDVTIAIIGLIVSSVPMLILARLREPVLLLILMGVFGLGFGMTALAGNVMIARGTTEVSRGLAMGFASTSRFAGLTMGPATATVVLSFLGESSYGFQVAFATMGVMSIAGALFAYLAGRNLSSHAV